MNIKCCVNDCEHTIDISITLYLLGRLLIWDKNPFACWRHDPRDDYDKWYDKSNSRKPDMVCR